ncbi:MAG: preprotein translocase subunit SecG [Proteobacteria bacterium]|nr:preprotein translocase subunit SecG [Pseudomonadota bacterium]
MKEIILIVHVLASISIIALVLLQHGKGADAGAAFGGGSQSMFGSSGASSFLSRTTAIFATIFFATSMTLAFFVNQQIKPDSVTESVIEQTIEKKADSTVPDVPVEKKKTDIPDVPQ